ncbi:tumor necrosis factor receptor superfamily member 5-like isoform X2 [Carcharodon carcharias]|uniref:tumor necrosis factor receptor superfamily member 5-like isoform X2 n=1 Tax=Carcharodon carcharias TaxID=13397 RepID=UPI001B7E4931|nr:tumor necrosis factor receptor superfamily member 5-like isoform X2 [Carcharodon carcharias]
MFLLRILIVTVASCALHFIQRGPCDEKEYEHQGFCCPKCKPGLRVGEHCTPNSGTQCHPCTNKSYQDSYNGDEKCKTCKLCGEGMFPIKDCTVTCDTVCDCLEGFHCDNITADGCGQCTEHSTCLPGEEMISKGAYRKDTVCHLLPSGSSISGEAATKPSAKGSEDSETGLTGCTTGDTYNIPAIILSLLLAIQTVMILICGWTFIAHYFHKACRVFSKKTDRRNGAETVTQEPVQEQGAGECLPVSVEEVSVVKSLTHTRPIHDFTDKLAIGPTLNAKDMGMGELQQLDLKAMILPKSSVEMFSDVEKVDVSGQ